ncbi:hypothetical protein [Paraburkholderia hospita]|uniref:Anthranilate dioxygenase reductase n=1 Tax=Paraburkholderia hospita TaxID=169430 RepID=A0AAJ4VNX3_9BURK|nr:hypothetical protein [Paraburkholderia hospita]EUC20266.1 hypothetical protein PMI06_002065 [Burkholderia sp. BT03]AUT73647.1 anthranilate dioxygenase reductase [Paraburkholderia hospita]EIM99158.1 anthranilate dioxygenase reductase [Paraburkholderia hospita]OUL72810.1 anthranilate dioxygenase reductase [Paraburkholderia hospita]OUL97219.1 anthranilate dioxygenase reductase [Paraburkholderia hospita]
MPASESIVSTRRDAAQRKAFVGGCIDYCSAECVYRIAREMFAEPKLFEREMELIFEKLCLSRERDRKSGWQAVAVPHPPVARRHAEQLYARALRARTTVRFIGGRWSARSSCSPAAQTFLPFGACWRSLPRGGGGQPAQLYYGVTNARDLCEAERLEACAARIEHYSHEVVVMNPAPEWQGKTGLIPEHLSICCERASSVTSMRGMTFRLKTRSGQRALPARIVCRVQAACRAGAHRLSETIPARSRPARNARRSPRTQNLSRMPIRNATWFGELDAASTGARFATAPPLACI